ncbi:MAG: hypothetical protein RIS94_3597 [Pseudomonadota bacterium]
MPPHLSPSGRPIATRCGEPAWRNAPPRTRQSTVNRLRASEGCPIARPTESTPDARY